jgi:hypothetical protein
VKDDQLNELIKYGLFNEYEYKITGRIMKSFILFAYSFFKNTSGDKKVLNL